MKMLMCTLRIGEAYRRFGRMLMEQFGYASGELMDAAQYSVRGSNCDRPGIKDRVMDSGQAVDWYKVMGSSFGSSSKIG